MDNWERNPCKKGGDKMSWPQESASDLLTGHVWRRSHLVHLVWYPLRTDFDQEELQMAAPQTPHTWAFQYRKSSETTRLRTEPRFQMFQEIEATVVAMLWPGPRHPKASPGINPLQRLQLQIVPCGAPATGMPAQALATVSQGDFLTRRSEKKWRMFWSLQGLRSWKALDLVAFLWNKTRRIYIVIHQSHILNHQI